MDKFLTLREKTININKLTEKDTYWWVTYQATDGHKGYGKLKFWNQKNIFMVSLDTPKFPIDNPDDFWDEITEPTRPEDLYFKEDPELYI